MAPAAPTHDYFVTLEIAASASSAEIKASYRRLALLHHPDKNAEGKDAATARMKLLNEAWDVLSDPGKKAQYDRTRPKFNASSSTSPEPPKPSPTAPPKPSWQPPPRPDTRAQEEARAYAERNRKQQEEENKKRQEWLNFERLQEQKIRLCRNVIKPLEAAIAAHNAAIDDNRAKLANDVPYAWNVFSFLKTRLSEEEKNEIRLASIQAESAIRIKRIPLDNCKATLEGLKTELERKRSQEEFRLFDERAEKERKERAADQKAERARRQEHAKKREEQEAKDKAAREAAERKRVAQEARDKSAREAANRARQEQWEAEKARMQAAREAAEREWRAQERERQEFWTKWHEDQAKEQAAQEKAARESAKKTSEEQERKRQATNNSNPKAQAKARNPTTKSSTACTHKGWWAKVQGRQQCTYCTATLYKFAQQCSGCGITSCDACRRVLQKGGTPSVDPSRRTPESGWPRV
jgi:curved DNA-binding protein CbpA